jgi:hypothetical protein
MHMRLALPDRIPSMRRSVPKRNGTLGLCRNGRAFRVASPPAWPIAFLAASPIFPLEPRFLAKEITGDSFGLNFSKSANAPFPPRF